MLLGFTPLLRLKRCHACDHYYPSQKATFLPGSTANTVATLKGAALQGDEWAPIADAENEWVEVGEVNRRPTSRTCWTHNAKVDGHGDRPQQSVFGSPMLLGFTMLL
jgi:hypothetical protein